MGMIKPAALEWDHILVLSVPIPLVLSFYFYANQSSLRWTLMLLIGWLFICLLRFSSAKLLFCQAAVIFLFSMVCQCEIYAYEEKKMYISSLDVMHCEGILYDLPKRTDAAYAFTIQTKLQDENIKLRVMATGNQIEPTMKKLENLPVGQTVQIVGKRGKNSGTQNFYGFDAVQYERQSHRIGTVFLSEIPIVQKNRTHSIHSILLNLRKYLMECTTGKLDFPTARIYADALVFGERTGMDEEIADLYQQYGLVHLLAISGMQIHLFTFGLFAIFLRIGFTKERLYILLLILQPVLFILTGASTSVARACVTTAFFLLFQIFFIQKDIAIPIILAFFATVLWNPDVCLDIGFQLSFFLSACLLLSRKILEKAQNMWSQMFMASLICQIASLPILLFHFHTYAPWSLLFNLLFIPFINFFVFPLSLLIVFLGLLHFPFIPVFVVILNQGVVWSERLLFVFSEWVSEPIVFAHPSRLLFLLEILLIFFFFTRVERTGWRKCRLAYLALVGIFVFHAIFPRLDPHAYVSFLDVGQGDSVVIITPFQKEVIVIDSGGVLPFRGEEKNQQIAKQIIQPYLQAKGVKKITHYIATHGDMDHIGTLTHLQKIIPIENLLVGKKQIYEKAEKTAIANQKQKGQKVFLMQEGSTWRIASGKITCLNPTEESREGNASSIVLFMQLCGRNFYFMGDAEKAEEIRIANTYTLPKADFLKVGHHGSKTSTDRSFVTEINPSYSVLSLGKNNSYGHPHAETLETLQKQGTTILRTDELGQIMCTFTEHSFTLSARVHMLTE